MDLNENLAVGTIQVLAPIVQEKSENTPKNDTDLDLARKIAEAIRPSGKQTMREEALRAALGGYNSFYAQQGGPDTGMRVALSALSKALRPFVQFYASPMDLIAVRVRQYSDEGMYQGTTYSCTPLGKLVRKELQNMKVL